MSLEHESSDVLGNDLSCVPVVCRCSCELVPEVAGYGISCCVVESDVVVWAPVVSLDVKGVEVVVRVLVLVMLWLPVV